MDSKRSFTERILPCKKYDSDDKLLTGLLHEETSAIQCLLLQVEKMVSRNLTKYGISLTQLQEILHDGILILIYKIKSEQFNSKLSSPKTYLFAICKNLCMNASRQKKHSSSMSLDELENTMIAEESNSILILEKVTLLKKMLNELGSPCKELIDLKYISELSDEEQIKNKLTKYSSLESLRVSRSQCMKKLLALSTKYKSSYAQL
ncbi:MAG: sigma-70 family RNA polymerase sigma factor [Saprospiraceae bacterium]|nr:sigma-70 family RNA polymerase sigma factor [Saprospiraceae bacterium]